MFVLFVNGDLFMRRKSRLNYNYFFVLNFFRVYAALQNRCVNMIAHLFHAPLGESETAVGVGTVGSSEAIMLAGLAFKRKWRSEERRVEKECLL